MFKRLGMVHVKDLLVITQEKKKSYKLKDFIREVLYVPESMMVKNAFEKMRLEKIQLAVVIDEYGGTAGIVTMEDILESIVGDIEDEYDEEEEDINLKSDGVYTLDGTADLEDVADELDITLPEDSEDYDTIGGYLTSILGRFPEEDETVELDAMGYHFKVLSVTDHHMDEIEATKLPDTTEKEED